MEKEFNILDEPWIKIITTECEIKEISLQDALLSAHMFEHLAGELPTQDFAILRLLLAVLHAVFYHVDVLGNEAPMENADDAITRWKELWKLGYFPEEPIREYLETWRERFWLFHPERPFYQANSAQIGTEYTTAKLNGELSESSNKLRLFPQRSGIGKSSVDYAEAARWLLHVNGFDDTSAKPKGRGLPSVGTGWLGKIGLIAAKGNTLFETLMLNFVLIDQNEEIWKSAKPIWEMETTPEEERVKIPLVADQAALLTLQSRRLLLKRESGRVIGYSLLGGDFFDRQNATVEQMTVWYANYEGNIRTGFSPKRHTKAHQMWRDFSVLTVQNDKQIPPGVILWNQYLIRSMCLPKRLINYQIASVQYGDKDFYITDIFSDSLSFSVTLFQEFSIPWRERIIVEIEHCEKIAKQIGLLAKEIQLAAGKRSEYDVLSDYVGQYFYRIDVPFRQWLRSLDPEEMELEDAMDSWRKQAKQIALEYGKQIVNEAGHAAFSGSTITEKKNNIEIKHFYSAPKSYNTFISQLNKLDR